MLQIIADVRGETADPVVPIRWCLSPDLLQKLRAAGAVDPQMLLSVQDDLGQETERRLVPLDQAIDYVSFRKAGTNKVNAAIVWADNTRKLRNRVLDQRNSKAYEYSIYSPFGFDENDKTFEPWRLSLSDLEGGDILRDTTAFLDITVGEEFFAGEPSRFEKWWVNLWHKYDPKDQCDFRQRRLLAYTLQPPVMLAFVIWMTFWRTLYATFTILMGVRGVNLETIFHPLRDSISETWKGDPSRRSDFANGYFAGVNDFFGSNAKGESYMFVFGLLRPAYWVLTALIIYGISLPGVDTMLEWLLVLKIAATLSFIGLVLITAFLAYKFVETIVAPGAEARRKAKREAALREQWRKEDRYAEITCGTAPLLADIGTLSNPTFALRFQALKAKVCRPYAA
ncbi:MAG: hypothetical protein JWN50_703 [Parcubacteria group bacterium]|nr:hypothetical protein [Parcubacteria group bacterium]